jgi:hypothetical protein
MDTIDISNLNRQFLFREADVGKSKALVAAGFVMKRVPGSKVTAHHCKIQDKSDEFYMSFNLVIAGLDSISARRWINAKLVSMVDMENPESLKPLIDGGTEGKQPKSYSTNSLRLQGPVARHPANNHKLLRVHNRHADPAYRIPNLHDRQHPASARTLHRVGERARVAARVEGQEARYR